MIVRVILIVLLASIVLFGRECYPFVLSSLQLKEMRDGRNPTHHNKQIIECGFGKEKSSSCPSQSALVDPFSTTETLSSFAESMKNMGRDQAELLKKPNVQRE
mmetsp:Transcript_11467/g.13169  ORF Transcript_11467/g.13169 Transcript_11467/m.13169 type:complete len:103 (-) Transcript_11467:7-315(-)